MRILLFISDQFAYIITKYYSHMIVIMIFRVRLISFPDAENAPKEKEGEDDGEGEEGTEAETEAETEPEPELTDEEESIRANLAEGEPLPNETLDKILPPFWNEEPFR